jgi:beta-lactamase superfamily II metal-dependent hydrolase
MQRRLSLAAIAALAALLAPCGRDGAAAQTRTTLDIYVVDVEGGNATLLVAPSGESLLIDTGNVAPEAAIRDADRILAATRDARLTQIDHLIVTHWHGDHFGGLAELAKRIPIRHFIDHGANVQPAPAADAFLAKTYPELYASAKHTVVKPGDRIAVPGLEVRVVTAAGETIKSPLPGAGAPNPYCASFKPGENNAEDPMSVGVHVRFGKFRTIHLGDLTRNKEFELMCPNNRIGAVDLLLGLHHGQATSNSEVLVHAVHPRVAVMNNGTRKGGEPETMRVVHTSPASRISGRCISRSSAGRNTPCRASSSPTCSMIRRPQCRWRRSRPRRSDPTLRRRRRTTGRPIGSRSTRNRTERSP